MTAAARVIEVGPRDGLQAEAAAVATQTKVELIDRLAATGLTYIEATSFVSPKAVPQLADAAEVMAQVTRIPGVTYAALVPNMRGYEAAREAGVGEIAVFTAASETFSRKNVNASIAESIARFEPVLEAAADDDVLVRGYVSTAFGCPYEGPVPPRAVHEVCEKLVDMGVSSLSIGDTIGVGVPKDVRAVCVPLLSQVPEHSLALHLHDTRGTALANVEAGLEIGITTFDSSIAGLGGCPFAPGATGNLATEDLVWFLQRNGLETGINLRALLEVGQWLREATGRVPAGHIAGTRVWPWSGDPSD